MEHIPQEELLSALLDGELSPDEAARVRAWVAENPAAQQLLDELQGLRASLQRLPKLQLGSGFADQVLRQAERQMLTADNDGQAQRATIPIGERPSVARRTAETGGGRGTRRLLWAVLATAAAVTLVLLLPRDVDQDGTQVAVNTPATNVDEGASGAIAAKGGAPTAGANRIPDDVLGRTAERSLGFANGRDTATKMGKLAAPQADAPLPQAQLAHEQQRFQQFELNKSRIRQRPLDEVSVVQVQVTPEAARTEQFAQLLARNAIDVTDESAPGESAATETTPAETVPAETVPNTTAPSPVADQPADTGPNAAPPPVDVIYVEATEVQLESTLAELTSQPKYFANVVVAEDPRQQFDFAETSTDETAPTAAAAPSAPAAESTEQPPAARSENEGVAPAQQQGGRAIARRYKQRGTEQFQFGLRFKQQAAAQAVEAEDGSEVLEPTRRVLFVLQVMPERPESPALRGGLPADAANSAAPQP